MVIDGKAGEKDWKDADWTEPFTDIAGSATPQYKTMVKMLRDDTAFYLIAWMEEPQVSASLKNHDDLLFNENDFEVFLDADGDGSNYAEIEINALGTVMDLKMDKPYLKGGKPDMGWSVPGLKSAVHIEGSLNNPADTDKGWFVEMSIPFAALIEPGHHALEHNWRINFLRVEKMKSADSNSPDLREYDWTWSPQGVVNMHIPEKWGFLRFAD